MMIRVVKNESGGSRLGGGLNEEQECGKISKYMWA
jgi:hypothetical protein